MTTPPFLHRFLKLPEGIHENPDSADMIAVHRRIIDGKPFLKRVYLDYYSQFLEHLRPLSSVSGKVLEIGTGGGFFKQLLPSLITSDVVEAPGIDRVIDAHSMPFHSDELKAIVMLNVLHHLHDPERFFSEMDRCLAHGGRLVLIEPAHSLWAGFLYRNFHAEPFDEKRTLWAQEKMGRFSTSNQALPWIILVRDRARFEKTYPRLKIVSVTPHTALMYALSGGLSFRPFAPSFLYGPLKILDNFLCRFDGLFPTMQTIVIQKA